MKIWRWQFPSNYLFLNVHYIEFALLIFGQTCVQIKIQREESKTTCDMKLFLFVEGLMEQDQQNRPLSEEEPSIHDKETEQKENSKEEINKSSNNQNETNEMENSKSSETNNPNENETKEIPEQNELNEKAPIENNEHEKNNDETTKNNDTSCEFPVELPEQETIQESQENNDMKELTNDNENKETQDKIGIENQSTEIIDQNVQDKENNTEETPAEPLDDFRYLQYDKETFDGPLREEWEHEVSEKLTQAEIEERREQEEMQRRAEQMKQEFYKKLEAERAAKLNNLKNKPPPRVLQSDQDDVAGGWKQVMDVVRPIRPNIDEKEMKKVKGLYFQMKG